MGSIIFLLFLSFMWKSISLVILNLFVVSIFISLYISFFISTWLGGLFFLVYVGAVLVILFYIFSLSSKVNILLDKYTFLMFMFFAFFIFLKKSHFKILEESKVYELFKDKILSFFDGFFVFFSLILFFGLWVASKLHIFNSLALRVFF